MAESLENLVEKFRLNLTENIRKLEEESHEKKASLEAKHRQEVELLGDKEKVEREEFDAKQSQRRRDLMLKQHQEKEKLKSNHEKKLKATKENHTCANTSHKEVPECPVCLEPMDPPMRIFQCSNGHYLCEDCNNNKEIKSCPSCRQQIVGRNIGMEQAIQLMGESTWRQREEAQTSGRGNVWECSACTFHNREDESICQMCGKIRLQTIVKESQNHLMRGNPNSEANKLGIFAMKSHKKEDHHGNIITIGNNFEENQKWDRSNVKQMQKTGTKLSNCKTSSMDLFRQNKLANASKGNGNRLANASKPDEICKENLHCPCPPYCPNCLSIVKMENLR